MEMGNCTHEQLSNLLLRRLVRRPGCTTRVCHPRLPNGYRGGGYEWQARKQHRHVRHRTKGIYICNGIGGSSGGRCSGRRTFVQGCGRLFYIANELLSIIENGGKLGAPIPPVIRQAIEVLKGKGGTGELPGNFSPKSKDSFSNLETEDVEPSETQDNVK